MKNKIKRKKSLVYNIIAHPIRIKILETLALKESISFTELKKELKLSTGSIYHHLSILGDFITQNEKRKYTLTKEGKKIYETFIKGKKEEIKEIRKNHYFLEKLYLLLLGTIYIQYINENVKKFSFISLIILTLGSLIFFYSKLEIKLLFLFETSFLNIFQPFISFISSFLIIYLISDLISTFILKSKGNHMNLLINISLVFLPLLIFSTIWFLNNAFFENILSKILNGWFLRFLFVIFQIWSLIILIKVIQISKRITLEKSAMIGLVIIYLSIVLFYIPA